ncbi:unnamed protein product [Urochloa decumbens]|uniref:Uncharacterized protein n=1 Tax=Urochloa decumbens TaxID=240449 RepID=A0ABC8WX19_9POAL
MASMGFGYAQIHVQQEKCKIKSLKAEENEKKGKESAAEGEKGGNRHTSEDNKVAVGGSWATGRVHPCAAMVAPVSPNGGK